MNSAAVHNCIFVWIWDKFSKQLSTLKTWLLDPVFWLWKTVPSCVIKWLYIHPTSSEGDLLFLILHQLMMSCICSAAVPISVVWYLIILTQWALVQFSSVAQSCLTLCDPMNCSMPGFPVYHQLPELAQTHVHRVSDAIRPSHPLSSPSPPSLNLSQHQGLFQWVSSSH